MVNFFGKSFYYLSEKHFWLLLAYKQELNKSQAKNAIYDCLGKDLNFGRHILPLTQELIDLGYIKRTNPDASSKAGHKHIITPEGETAVFEYLENLKSISKWEPSNKLSY